MAVKWEYRSEHYEDRVKFVEAANALGDEGWELIDIESVYGYIIGFFKRPYEDDKSKNLWTDARIG
jgi:hypothetical protein